MAVQDLTRGDWFEIKHALQMQAIKVESFIEANEKTDDTETVAFWQRDLGRIKHALAKVEINHGPRFF